MMNRCGRLKYDGPYCCIRSLALLLLAESTVRSVSDLLQV